MPLIITVAIVSIVSLAITFFLTDRSHWPKILLVIGIVAAGLSGLQAYHNRERADDLQTQVAKATDRAAQAELDLAKFRAPRTLTTAQQNTIKDKVHAYAGVRFDATVIRGDPETYQLLDMIMPALAAAGWTWADWDNNDAVMKRPNGRNVGEWAATNVIIAVPHDLIPQLSGAANALAAALTAENVPAQAQDASGMNVKNNDLLHLLIGRKM